jgi:DNA modification methylase
VAVADQLITENFAVYNADCMEVLPSIPDSSVGVSVYSPPFPELYQYSNDPRDMSNCKEYTEGIEQYRYVVEQIARVTRRGRLTCVHCMDLKRGSYFQRDFPGDIIRTHEAAGFNFVCRVTIWKDPWLIARRTRMKSLRHKNIVEDSATVRIGPADYVLVFKKGWENDVPIRHPYGLKEYAGETPIPEDLLRKFKNYKGDQRKNLLSHWIWRRYASPVWMDIRTGRLMPYLQSKENEEERHVCPLQRDVVERLLTLYSNPEDTVLTPFMGVGSEVYTAVQMGRKAIGIELKPSYYRQSVRNLTEPWTDEFADDDNLEFEWYEDDDDNYDLESELVENDAD